MGSGPLPWALKCCGVCWCCKKVPDTISIATGPVLDPNCAMPSGTFTVGSAASSVLNVAETYCQSPPIAANRNSYQWSYKKVQTLGTLPSTGCTVSAGTDYVEVSNAVGSPGTNTYYIVLNTCTVTVVWDTLAGNRVTIAIRKIYELVDCLKQVGPGSGRTFIVQVDDFYVADHINCSSLPSSINYTTSTYNVTTLNWNNTARVGRTIVGTNVVDPSSLATFSFTYSLCSIPASISITYV